MISLPLMSGPDVIGSSVCSPHLLRGEPRGVGVLVGGLGQRVAGGEGARLPLDVLQLCLALLRLEQRLRGLTLLVFHLGKGGEGGRGVKEGEG